MPNPRAWDGAAGTQDRIGLGIAGLLIGMFAISFMDSLAKWLGEGYPIAELVFLRHFLPPPPAPALPLPPGRGWARGPGVRGGAMPKVGGRAPHAPSRGRALSAPCRNLPQHHLADTS